MVGDMDGAEVKLQPGKARPIARRTGSGVELRLLTTGAGEWLLLR